MEIAVKKAQKITLISISLMLFTIILLYLTTTTAEFGQKQPRSLAELGGDFILQSATGPVALNDYKGKAVVLYFGFLSCPDVCPNSMSVIAGALNKLPQSTAENTQVILISVDPERDTPEQLAKFTEHFYPNFVGLTGTQADIDKVTQQYGAYYNIIDSKKTDNYTVEHSSRYYVIDKNGQLVDAMRHSTTSNELAARIKTVLKG